MPHLRGTLHFPVNVPVEPYDPWSLPYFKAPSGAYSQVSKRTITLTDVREDVLGSKREDGSSNIETAHSFLDTHGFTAVRHATTLIPSFPTLLSNFQDLERINKEYYPEVEALIKSVTGCDQVCITDSIIRGPQISDTKTLTDSDFAKSENLSHRSTHKAEPAQPQRLPHWDATPLGARQMIRNWSREITDLATSKGIIRREDELCAPGTSVDVESDCRIKANYKGPRYAFFSVWRPLNKVTRDPLAMLPIRSLQEDEKMIPVPFVVKQPGTHGDWLREAAMLKVMKGETADSSEMGDGDNAVDAGAPSNLCWHYVSELDVDEVLVIKAFDSDALAGQVAGGVPHGSPDLGDAGYGDARYSIEVRLLAFW